MWSQKRVVESKRYRVTAVTVLTASPSYFLENYKVLSTVPLATSWLHLIEHVSHGDLGSYVEDFRIARGVG